MMSFNSADLFSFWLISELVYFSQKNTIISLLCSPNSEKKKILVRLQKK